jgi:transposase
MTNLLLMAFDLSAPMTGKQFLLLPKDYRRVYLDGLIGRFGTSDEMLSEMFGIHKNTIFRWRKELGVDASGYGTLGMSRNPSAADLARWHEWLQTGSRCAALKSQIEEEHPEVTVL